MWGFSDDYGQSWSESLMKNSLHECLCAPVRITDKDNIPAEYHWEGNTLCLRDGHTLNFDHLRAPSIGTFLRHLARDGSSQTISMATCRRLGYLLRW